MISVNLRVLLHIFGKKKKKRNNEAVFPSFLSTKCTNYVLMDYTLLISHNNLK